MLRKLDNTLARMAEKVTIVDPVFRLSISLIFIIGGLGHFFAHQHMLGRMHLSPWRSHVDLIGNPSVLLWLSGAIFIAAGITLALGWMTRISAAALFLTLVPITVAVHVAPGHTGPLLKNVAILGSLFYLFVRGPGRWALDHQLQPFITHRDR